MIFFKPVVNPENSSEITFEALENDSVAGRCTMITDGNKAEIVKVDLEDEKPYIFEGLIKSAFNYACGKNCYMGYCKCEKFSVFLDKMNFIEENGIYYNDIPSILQGNCCKTV